MADETRSKYRVRSAKLALRMARKMPSNSAKVVPVVIPGTGTRKRSEASMIFVDGDKSLQEPDDEERAIASWIRSRFKKRVCNKFVPQKLDQPEKESIQQQPPSTLLNPKRKHRELTPLDGAPSHPQTPRSHDPMRVEYKKIDYLCKCNYKKNKHSSHAQKSYRHGDKDWKVTRDTVTETTDAMGEMEHVHFGQKISKYVRVEHQTDIDVMLDLLMKQWQLKKPSLLISVTGGAKNFTMKPRLKEVFRRGLMKAAESTGAWITTGGMHAGVMKHVGEAVRDHMVAHGNKRKVVTLGISPWGCINGKELLVERSGKGLWPAEYRPKETTHRKVAPLDPNHSHFIMVDNGTQHMYGTEIAFRAALESRISRMKTEGGIESAVSIPIVCVVLEGGPGTLETVKSAIQNGTPAVIVEGSGRAADVLAYAYANSSEEEVEVIDKYERKHKKVIPIFDADLWEKVRKKIQDEWKTDKDLDMRVNWVRECLEKRDHMTVFQLDGSQGAKDIDIAILQALLKVCRFTAGEDAMNKDKSLDQLKLALAWNRIDVAKSDIFTDNSEWESKDLVDVLYTAILQDRHDFVTLFLENGVSLKDMLTPRRLLQLYNDIPSNCQLHELLRKRKDKRRKKFSFEDIGHLIQLLIGDFYRPIYLDKDYRRVDADALLMDCEDEADVEEDLDGEDDVDVAEKVPGIGASLMVPFTSRSTGSHVYLGQIVEATGEQELLMIPDFEEPARELFIWSVLMHRLDMAMLFWEEGKQGMSAALTAQRLLTSLRLRTEDSEVTNQIDEQIVHFGKLSVGVLSECYAADERQVQLLLVRELPSFGHSTCVMLAVEADNKEFIAHTACQSLLNSIWLGRMHPDNGLIRMLVCMVLPFLIFPLIRFRGDNSRVLQSEEETKQPEPAQNDKHMDLKELIKRKSLLKKPSNLSRNGTTLGARPQTTKGKRDTLQEQASVTNKSRKPNIPWYKILVYFYNAPVITFIINCIAFIAFLMLYSVVILTEFAEQVQLPEIILIIWTSTLLVEEIRQVIGSESNSLKMKLKSYVTDMWNILDIFTLTTFYAGVALRFVPTTLCPDCLIAARVILAINLLIFYFRLLHIFSIHKELGPKLVMIGKMMIDLMYFVVILMVFIIAYGVAVQAIMYPNSNLEWSLLTDLLKRAYFQIYGELFLEEIEGENGCQDVANMYRNDTVTPCRDESTQLVVSILMGAYILITNVLMLNLLIAMFSYTFSIIQEKTDLHWYFQRYFLIKEYYDRPPLPPPLIILSHIFLIWRFFLQCCCKQCINVDNMFRIPCSETEEKRLVLWENMNAEEYRRRTVVEERMQMEHRVKDTNDRVDQISHKVEEMSESSLLKQTEGVGPGADDTTKHRLPPALDTRLKCLEEQLARTTQALKWIMDAMADKGMVAKQARPVLKDPETLKEEERRKREQEMMMRKKEFGDMLLRQLELHIKSRTTRYPTSDPQHLVQRLPVPDNKVPWDELWAEYEPILFTDAEILRQPVYADINLLEYSPDKRPALKYNSYDVEYEVDRQSHDGEYPVREGLPFNPKGRTGLSGRGALGRWGPNHAGDPVVTRWKRNEKGEVMQEQNKPVLEFIAIQRSDNKEWAIPGAILGPCRNVHRCLKAEFQEEAMGITDPHPVNHKLDQLWKLGKEVYRGYADDPRNTDNAWLETIALNYHDEDGSLLKNLHVKAGNNAEFVRWQRISSRLALYGGHLHMLKIIADLHKAAF